MSENEQLEDFSSYDGSYQAGQLLHEEGEIDLDELGDPNAARAPLTAQLLIVLFLCILGAGGYYVFIHSKPVIPITNKLVKPKVDQTVQKTYKALKEVKKNLFSPLFACAMTLERNSKSANPSLQKDLLDDCKPLKAGAVSYQPLCKDKESCKKPALGKCTGGKCTAVPNTTYMDFAYALMLRYANSYDELYAYQRLYYAAQRKFKSSKGKDAASQKAMESYKSKMSSILSMNKSADWSTPYYAVQTGILYKQAIAYVGKVNAAASATKTDGDKAAPKKKKRRRRRRRRRRKKKAAATVKMLHGGQLWISKRFPGNALTLAGFSTIFQSERLARQASLIRKYNYSPMALHFWGNLLIKRKLLACAGSARVGDSAKASMEFDTVSERVLKDTVNVAEGSLKACGTTALKSLQLFSTNPDDKKVKVHYTLSVVN